MLVNHLVAAVSSLSASFRFAALLEIRRGEWSRYLKKSINLALCYAGFSDSWNLRQAWRAGLAGFLCCAYDVVTDWRTFDPRAREGFERLLELTTERVDLRKAAMALYDDESNGIVVDDGLKRGEVSLVLVLELMGCREAREAKWGNLAEIGRRLQIVDDVLDYEHDRRFGDLNCLTSEMRSAYVAELLLRLDEAEARRIFGRSVVTWIIRVARERASELLNVDNVESLSIESGPRNLSTDP